MKQTSGLSMASAMRMAPLSATVQRLRLNKQPTTRASFKVVIPQKSTQESRRNVPKQGKANHRTLGREVYELLDSSLKLRQSTEIIRAITDTITNALRQGKKVEIAGFGIGRLVNRRSYREPIRYFNGNVKSYVTVPARQAVRFFPSKVLATMLVDKNNPFIQKELEYE